MPKYRFNKILRGPDGDYPCGRDQDLIVEASSYQDARRKVQARSDFGQIIPGTRSHATYQIVKEETN